MERGRCLLPLPHHPCCLQDTAGAERYRAITRSYYNGAQGILLVYDITDRVSFDGLRKWFSDLDAYVSSAVVRMVVGNKVDKVRVSLSHGPFNSSRSSSSPSHPRTLPLILSVLSCISIHCDPCRSRLLLDIS